MQACCQTDQLVSRAHNPTCRPQPTIEPCLTPEAGAPHAPRQATGNSRVLDAAGAFVAGLNAHARVPGGYAVVRSVASMALEDVQPSYFLAETCKYLFLIADPSFLQARPPLNTPPSNATCQ